MSIIVKCKGERVQEGAVVTDWRGNEWTLLAVLAATELEPAKVWVENRDLGWREEVYAYAFNITTEEV